MQKGKERQLLRQMGEYLVASELGRRGILATTFSGNIPVFDIIATGSKGKFIPIQVKTIKAGCWQFKIDDFVNISFRGKIQFADGKKKVPIKNLIYVLVLKGKEYGKDEFYILEWKSLRDILVTRYKKGEKGTAEIKRPRNPESTHNTLQPRLLKSHKDKWSTISKLLK